MQSSVKEIYDKVLLKFQGNKRLEHILGVAKLAKELANKYGLDEEKAYIAGLLHDYAKYEPMDKMLEIIADKDIIDRFKETPQVYHAYASAVLAKDEFGITDLEIINAIKYHVYGRVGMNMLEKIVMISDYCEDSRPYEECKECRRILDSGKLSLAIYTSLSNTINSVNARGLKLADDIYAVKEEIEKEPTINKSRDI